MLKLNFDFEYYNILTPKLITKVLNQAVLTFSYIIKNIALLNINS